MKKTLVTVLSLFSLLIAPASTFAAVNNINGQNGQTQTLATTTGATTMHMTIVSAANTHTFQWDNSPWSVNQGGTGQTTFTAGALIYGDGTNPLATDPLLSWNSGELLAGRALYFNDYPGEWYIDASGSIDGLFLNSPDAGSVVSFAAPGHGQATFDISAFTNTKKVFSFPDYNGTFGLLEANQNWTGANTFDQGPVGTTTVNFGHMGSSTSHVCFNTKNTDGQDVSFFIVGTSIVVEANACQ